MTTASAMAQIGGGGSSSTATSQNVFCEKNLTSTVTRVTKSALPSGYSDLKDV